MGLEDKVCFCDSGSYYDFVSYSIPVFSNNICSQSWPSAARESGV